MSMDKILTLGKLREMTKDLDDKTVVLIGPPTGIGKHAALLMAAHRVSTDVMIAPTLEPGGKISCMSFETAKDRSFDMPNVVIESDGLQDSYISDELRRSLIPNQTPEEIDELLVTQPLFISEDK